jgi:hypothetical protein
MSKSKNIIPPRAEADTNEDYTLLSNDELQRLLHERAPRMTSFRVNDQTRATAIAMLKVTDKDK